MSFTDKIATYLQKKCHITANDTVIVGVSAGPDSTALLDLLCQLNLHLRVIAVYVDHGLRPNETEAEKQLVARQASQLGAEFETVSVDVPLLKKTLKTSTEDAARIGRYQALEEVRIKYDGQAIAVGHTGDDQAEELLIRLIRGSGRGGLSGMKARNNLIVRPLLSERKETLINYLQQEDIEFCQDSSNLDRSFLRNRIRLDLLPYLEQQYNQSIRETILQTITILESEDSLLERMTCESFKQIVSLDYDGAQGRSVLPRSAQVGLEDMQKCHKAIQRRILEKLCWRMSARPNFRLIEQLLNLFNRGINGAEVHLKKGLRAVKSRENVTFYHPAGITAIRGSGVAKPTIHQLIDKVGSYNFPELNGRLSVKSQNKPPKRLEPSTLMVDHDLVTFPLLLRSRQNGDKFRPLGSPGRKKISRFLSDRKIPKIQRSFHPVLLAADKIVALAGLQIDDHFRIRDKTKRFLLIDWKHKRELV